MGEIPPGEYERVLIRLGILAHNDGPEGDVLIAMTNLDPIAPHVRKVACGHTHCLLLTQRGQVYLISTTGVNTPSTKSLSLLAIEGRKAVDIAAGDQHYLVVTECGRVYTLGHGRQGQLGTGGLNSEDSPVLVKGLQKYRVVGAACGAAHSIVWTDTGLAFAFGRGEEGQLGSPDILLQAGPHHITSLAGHHITKAWAKGHVTALLEASGRVFVCGDGTMGQLGQGHPRAVHSPVALPMPDAVRVVDLALGWGHLVVVDEWRRVWACGINTKGQLGFGTAEGKYLQLQPVSVTPAAHIQDKRLTWPQPITSTILQAGSIPFANLNPTSKPPSPQSLPVTMVCAGDFWTGALHEGDLYVWGSFGSGLELSTAKENITQRLPPHAAVVDIWPMQDSALLLVDLFVAHSAHRLSLSVATLGDLNLNQCKDFVAQHIQKQAPQLITSITDVHPVGIRITVETPGNDVSQVAWPEVVQELSGSPDTSFIKHDHHGTVVLQFGPDPVIPHRVLHTSRVSNCKVLIAQCSQTVTLTVYGPSDRLPQVLHRLQGATSEDRPMLPPLYTIGDFELVSQTSPQTCG